MNVILYLVLTDTFWPLMATLRMVRTRIQLQLMYQNQSTTKNFYNFWLISLLKEHDIDEYKIEDKIAVVHRG